MYIYLIFFTPIQSPYSQTILNNKKYLKDCCSWWKITFVNFSLPRFKADSSVALFHQLLDAPCALHDIDIYKIMFVLQKKGPKTHTEHKMNNAGV